jgi:hypothetical protein
VVVCGGLRAGAPVAGVAAQLVLSLIPLGPGAILARCRVEAAAFGLTGDGRSDTFDDFEMLDQRKGLIKPMQEVAPSLIVG